MDYKELFHEEIKNLTDFRSKLETHSIHKDDLDEFAGQYDELVSQAKVITKVSDRLQKKLDKANVQIREQNHEISEKNETLEETITQLAKAQVGRRASTIMLTVGLTLFILEQIFLEPFIETKVDTPYLGYGILVALFFLVKGLESALEKYFMNQEKKKILKGESNTLQSNE